MRGSTGSSLCQPSSKWLPFFESGKDKAPKREQWVPRSISTIKWPSNPQCFFYETPYRANYIDWFMHLLIESSAE